ncbi:DNA-directed RNA polymerase, alpha subunit/40 kD subunit [Candidatus Methanoperedens nitroreducens]|uniref:DNA-directed RNA polymerase subunit Rpo3 n=2 Tax=Candidatus Methanoperedens nitratireducens TaxID=1392998 RepID=A0A062UXH0_9EURY|nr:DNA-directed RNA polymerase, alpha subunit/40 kD subunit [Candidatus Methanoperedens nitroreducens]
MVRKLKREGVYKIYRKLKNKGVYKINMDIDIIELSERKARFVLSGVPAAFANALRRSILAEVPVLAIADVNIYDNTSVLFDEQLALRLGLIPLKADTKRYVLPEECTCQGQGCPLCQVSLTLSAEGPKVVYSGDMISTDPDVRPADATVPIVELKEKHKVVVESIARLGTGTGRSHSKWQAGIASGYKNMPVLTVGECDGCGKCIELCPRNILKLSGDKVSVTDVIECSMCRICEEACDMNSISVSYDPESFVMTFETSGSTTAAELAIEATESIKKRAGQLGEILNTF